MAEGGWGGETGVLKLRPPLRTQYITSDLRTPFHPLKYERFAVSNQNDLFRLISSLYNSWTKFLAPKMKTENVTIYDIFFWLFTLAQLERMFAGFQNELHHIKMNNERFTMERMNFSNAHLNISFFKIHLQLQGWTSFKGTSSFR